MMETALWNGILYTISEIAEDYELENRIRAAKKELRCPDPNCANPILRYCHGDQRNYFAHLDNCECNYKRYEKDLTPLIRKVKSIVYDVLRAKGFNIKIDARITETEYAHLLIELSDEKRLAIEFATPQITQKRVRKIIDKYNRSDIELCWIVVSNFQTPLFENDTCFIKRHLLNESINHDVIILDEDGVEIVQYKEDRASARVNSRTDIYRENSEVSSLSVENTAVTIGGFKERYNKWWKERHAPPPPVIPVKEVLKESEKEVPLKSTPTETKESPETIESIVLPKPKLNLYPNAEKLCPTCGLPMEKKKNLIGKLFWRCISDNRDHSVPFAD